MNWKIKILGFAIAISYIIVILYTWAKAEYSGYVYFLAGEPNRTILYSEWILGLLAVAVISNEFKRTIAEKARVMYDPPV